MKKIKQISNYKEYCNFTKKDAIATILKYKDKPQAAKIILKNAFYDEIKNDPDVILAIKLL